MKKLLIASAVSAAFAAPTVALAQAARAPTLSQVLDASGINVSGYFDAAYTYANRNLEGGVLTDRVFDSQNNSFALHQFGLQVAKQPSRGFGGVVNITAGSDAQVIHAFPETTAGAGSMFDITQAYGQYAAGDLTLMAGKFVTLAGSEVIWSPSNTNFSRSILFGAIPFTHTGVRAGYALSNTVTLYGGINNGWDQLTDANKGKTIELGATIVPSKPLTINVTGYFGKEAAVAPGTQPAAAQDQRNLLNVVATYTINNRMSAGGEVLYVSQDRAVGGSAKYNGLAGYFTYNLNREWRVAARAEMFDDKNGFHFAPAAPFATSDTKYKEVTATLAYLPNSSVELRGEIRGDQANNAVFRNSDGTTAKSLLTLAFQGI
ncbi:MAG TPA: outer membrane beta-barrel protein, partial [Burkholderiales bacterium]|nr:outer membrane beta-barrel protein [Burkholderiales bacterium]